MQQHMLTVSAFALVIASGGLTPAVAQQTEAQDPVDLTTWVHAPLYEGWRAEELLATPVYGSAGEDIGEIENIIVDPDGKVESIVVEAGGFWDIGDVHFEVPWDQVEVSPGLDRVTVPVDEDNVANFSLFGDDGDLAEPREWRVTELMGDYATLTGGIAYGYVDDLVFSREGQLEAVVIVPDYGYGLYAPYAYPYYGYAYGWDPALTRYELPYAEEDIGDLEPFDYDQMEGAASEDGDTPAGTAN